MTPRLIASDLDGTLLSPASVLSERTIRTVHAAQERGVEVVAVTGRGHRSAVDLLRPAPGIRWIIASNGASVWDGHAEAVVVERPLEADVVSSILAAVEDRFPSVGLAWETASGVFHTDAWITNRRATDPQRALLGYRNPAEDGFSPVHGEVLKLMLAHDRLVTTEWLDALSPHLPTSVSASTSGAKFVEITRGDANKGDALAELCAQLGVSAPDVVAFGDHTNDLPMLRWAGRGYAMANADPRAVAAADAGAPSNAEDGVADVVERLLDLPGG